MAEVWRLFGAAAADSVAAKIYSPANDISCPLHVFGESRAARRSESGDACYVGGATVLPFCRSSCRYQSQTLRLYHDPLLSSPRQLLPVSPARWDHLSSFKVHHLYSQCSRSHRCAKRAASGSSDPLIQHNPAVRKFCKLSAQHIS